MKCNYYICKILLFFAFLNFSGHAQNPVIKHYSVNQGLPSSECYWGIQDGRGYLWIATDAGVVKYDGYKFITYNSSRGLPDNTVFKIHEDRYGKIWFASYSGKMSYYSHHTDSVYEIKANARLNEVTKLLPVEFAFDDHDTLYISLYRKGYVKIHPPGYEKIQEYFFTQYVYFAKQVNKNELVYGVVSPYAAALVSNGRYKLPIARKIPFVYDYGSKEDIFAKDTAFKIWGIDSHNHLIKYNDTSFLFSNSRSIILFSKNSKRILVDKYEKGYAEKDHIITLYKDTENRIWINKLNDGTHVYADINLEKELYHFLPKLSVTSVCQDINGGFWLTTLEDGLFYIPSLGFNFMDQNSGLSANKVLSIALIKDNLYCLTSDFVLSKYELSSRKNMSTEKLIYSSWYLAQSDSTLLICQALPYLLNIYNNKKAYPWIIIDNNRRPIKFKKVINYTKDHFLGFDGGHVVLINKKTGECKFIVSGLPTIFSIQFQKNIIWVGTKSGLYSYTDNELYFHGKNTAILKNRVEDMLVIGDTLFLATRGYGVLCMLNNKVIQHYTEKSGLASDMTKCIIKDNSGNIWVGTNRGISRLKKTETGQYNISTLNMNSGLVSNEVNQIIEYRGKLYFATNNGLGILNVADFYNPNVSIPVYIEAFYVNNIKHNVADRYLFDYHQNFINIIYKGVCLKSEGDINYKYRLEGLDTSWTYSKNTYVQFTTLPPGDYKFVVYAINQDSRLSDHPETISFTIQKPFWKTWWFYLLTGLSIFIIIYVLYDSRVKFIKQQEKEKTESNKRISESELKALRAQMNPHFMFNAINSIQNFVLKNDSRSAQKYLTKFARLIRSVLENSKHESVWLSKEVEALELYIELEALRASFSFDYEVIIDDSLNAINLFIPPMIIQPYIENAILHGIVPLTERKGKLQVKFSQEGSALKCVIDDNGIGRALAQEIRLRKQQSHQSMGMNVTQDRITILNQHTHNMLTSIVVLDKVVNGMAMGTTVEISINLKKSQND
jgi:hypothetical protein